MFKKLCHYLFVYKEFVSVSIAQGMDFRFNFALAILADLAFAFTTVVTSEILFLNVDHIGNWDHNSFMFFVAYYNMIEFCITAMCAPSYWNFTQSIRTGALDYRLLKPLNSIYTSFFSIIRPTTIFCWWVPLSLLIYYGTKAQLSLLSWLCMPFLIIFSTAIVMLIDICTMSISFWVIGSEALNYIRIQCRGVARWPRVIYPMPLRFLFSFIIPLAAYTSYPAELIVFNFSFTIALTMICIFLSLCILLRFLWSAGLSRYESASS